MAEFNSFPSHVVNKHTGLEDPSLIWQHSSQEILRIGMFRTPFSCGYYQYIENIHLARTKIILSCLFLLEAHVLELYYRPLESSTMVTHAYAYQSFRTHGRFVPRRFVPRLGRFVPNFQSVRTQPSSRFVPNKL